MNAMQCSHCPMQVEGLSSTELWGAVLLAHHGVPLAVIGPARRGYNLGEFAFGDRKSALADCRVLNDFAPGDALIALTGQGIDVIDVDERNGGAATYDTLKDSVGEVLAQVATPSGSFHIYVASTGHPTIRVGGIDYLAEGSLVYLPGTRRPRYNGKGYSWRSLPRFAPNQQVSDFPVALGNLRETRVSEPPSARHFLASDSETSADIFGPAGRLAMASRTVREARKGHRNRTLYNVAFAFTFAVGEDNDALARLSHVLHSASELNRLVADDGRHSVMATIASGVGSALKARA